MPNASSRRSPGTTHDWRDAVATASGLNFLLGIWLLTAPYVLGYGDGDPVWSDVVCGALVALLAFARATQALAEPALSYLNLLAGTWVFAAAFWLYDSGRATWNDLIAGAAIAILAALSVTASENPEAAERTWSRR